MYMFSYTCSPTVHLWPNLRTYLDEQTQRNDPTLAQ